jgi:hypothetical protein
MRYRLFGVMALLLATALIGPAVAADSDAEIERKQAELDAHIAELIEQLGSPDFPVREKATRELVQIGLPAFDALQAAQFHRDLEIGLRAKYLVGSSQVAWAKDDDPPEVKSILKDYGQLPEVERKTRIERLGLLDNRQGWPALCRLARYEREERLSKQAALAIITREELPAVGGMAAAKSLQLGAGDSRRQASLWLRAYARWLNEPETIVSEWTRLVHAEFELIAEKERSSLEIVTALGRWHAETLHRLGHAAETKEMIKRLAAILNRPDAPAGLHDHVAWLAHRELWSYILEAHRESTVRFKESAELLYYVAEAQLKLGDVEAMKTAAAAKAIKTDGREHMRIAEVLAKRGLFDWAEGELRTVLESEDLLTENNVKSRRQLAEMLHDQQFDKAAGEALEPIATALAQMDVDQFGKRQPNPMRLLIESLHYSHTAMVSRMHYFFAVDHLQRGETEQALARLNKGISEDSDDVDVLIALFRLPEQTSERRAETRRLIRLAADKVQSQIDRFTMILAQQGPNIAASDVEDLKRAIASGHNQFAWLVANTEGDFEAAVAASHESLKLRPGEPAYLDTLGCSYFAAGDLTNSIKYQSEAIRKEPHSGQMQRQLARFKQAAEKGQ